MGALHVSIHDVAPPFRREVELALEMCSAVGARPALLVVPDFHGEAPLAKEPRFASFLRSLQSDGHEVFLHGYFHRSRRVPRSLSQRFAQTAISSGEAEMSELTEAEAAERIDAGLRVLEDAGLRVEGFVPPAWAMPRWLMPMLAARAFAYAEDHLRAYIPSEGRARATVLLNYASRTPARLLSTVAFCRLVAPLGRALPTRLALHPADLRYALLRHELERLLAAGRGRFVGRARDLFA